MAKKELDRSSPPPGKKNIPESPGVKIRVDEFGRIVMENEVEKINEFLNEAVKDKKLNEDEA